MEDDTWQPGTVARVQVEHEGGTAPFAVQLDRGDAVIAPADEERFIRPLGGLRFRVGDRVECHVEDDRWSAGMWSGSNPKPKPKPKPNPNPNPNPTPNPSPNPHQARWIGSQSRTRAALRRTLSTSTAAARS